MDDGRTLLMRPLLLHSSGRSNTQSHRRVIHIEYAGLICPVNSTGMRLHETALFAMSSPFYGLLERELFSSSPKSRALVAESWIKFTTDPSTRV